ncbi:hypothetical protein GVAV_003027 [Gurleya vavrai]
MEDKNSKNKFISQNIFEEINHLKKIHEVNFLRDILILIELNDTENIKKEITNLKQSVSLADNAAILYTNFLKKGLKNNSCYICKKEFFNNEKEKYSENITNIIIHLPQNVECKKNQINKLNDDLKKLDYENEKFLEVNNKIKNIQINILKLCDNNENVKLLQCIKQYLANNQTSYEKIFEITIDKFHKYLEKIFNNDKFDVKKVFLVKIFYMIEKLKKYIFLYNDIQIDKFIELRPAEIIIEEIQLLKNELNCIKEKLKLYKSQENLEDLCNKKKELCKVMENHELKLKNIKDDITDLEKNLKINKSNFCIAENNFNEYKITTYKKIDTIKENLVAIKKHKEEYKLLKQIKTDLDKDIVYAINNLIININELETILITENNIFITDNFKITNAIEEENFTNLSLFEEKKDIDSINLKLNNLEKHFKENVNKFESVRIEITNLKNQIFEENKNIKNLKECLRKQINNSKISELKTQLKNKNLSDIKDKKENLIHLETKKMKFNNQKCMLQGELKQIESSIILFNNELKYEYNNIINLYTNCYIEIKAFSLILEDI